jgi:hypothetical protein
VSSLSICLFTIRLLTWFCRWEFASTLHFDIDLIVRNSGVPRSGWVRWVTITYLHDTFALNDCFYKVYLSARLLLLAAIVNTLVGVNINHQYNCEVRRRFPSSVDTQYDDCFRYKLF